MQSRRINGLLLLAIFLGLALSLMGSGIDTNLKAKPHDWLVSINGDTITQSDFLESQARLAGKISDGMILSLMIDNVLLIQRAKDLGLIDNDRVVKKAIVHSVIEQTVRSSIRTTPDESQLKAFYENNKNVFSVAKKVKLNISQIGQSNCQSINHEPASAKTINHPASQGWITRRLLQRQLGPSLANKIMSGAKGQQILHPQQDGSCLIIKIEQLQAETVTPFHQVKDAVLGEYRNQSRRQALSGLLNQLKQNSTIIYAKQVQGDIHD